MPLCLLALYPGKIATKKFKKKTYALEKIQMNLTSQRKLLLHLALKIYF